ncbi:hypothetical protein Tco_0223406 [Tanacetum coccineum]
MLAISLFPTTFAEPMAKMVLKEAQGLWMAWIYSLKSLTKETQEEEAEDIAYKHPSDTYVFTMKMEILLEPISNKLMVGRSSQDLEVQVKMEMEIPRSSGVNFITACSYSTDTSKDLMKAHVYVSKLPQL